MKKILSIDWDYFINATATQRSMLFPDGGNESLTYELQDFIWNRHYTNPELEDIGILKKEYELINKMLRKFVDKCLHNKKVDSPAEVLCTVSHRWIYDFITLRTNRDEEFEVYNVDFHHDMYCYKTEGQEVNCGNWVNCLLERRPNMQYHWVKREDSDDEVIGGYKVDCPINTLEDIKDLDFDYVFLCRSDCWSPPHLDNYFETLWVLMIRSMPISIESKVSHIRKVSALSEAEQKYGANIAIIKDMQKYPNATCVNCGDIIPEGSSSFFCDKCNKVD